MNVQITLFNGTQATAKKFSVHLFNFPFIYELVNAKLCIYIHLYFFSVSADINAVQITCDEYLEQFALVFSPVLQHALEIPLFANDTDCASALASHVLWRGLLNTNTCCHQQNIINTFQIKIILECHSYRNSCDNSSTKLIESIKAYTSHFEGFKDKNKDEFNVLT